MKRGKSRQVWGWFKWGAELGLSCVVFGSGRGNWICETEEKCTDLHSWDQSTSLTDLWPPNVHSSLYSWAATQMYKLVKCELCWAAERRTKRRDELNLIKVVKSLYPKEALICFSSLFQAFLVLVGGHWLLFLLFYLQSLSLIMTKYYIVWLKKKKDG